MSQNTTNSNGGSSSESVIQVETRNNQHGRKDRVILLKQNGAKPTPSITSFFAGFSKGINTTGQSGRNQAYASYVQDGEEVKSLFSTIAIGDRIDLNDVIEQAARNLMKSNQSIAGLATLAGGNFVDIPPVWDGTAQSKTYIVDMRSVLSIADPDAYDDVAFVFYPGEIKGFIESCILATQRQDELINREVMIFKDITAAHALFAAREENHYARDGRFDEECQTPSESEIENAMNLGVKIDQAVRSRLEVLAQVHGNYAVDANSFVWTNNNALVMTLVF